MNLRNNRLLGLLASIVMTVCIANGVYATQEFTVSGELIPEGIYIHEGTGPLPTLDSKNLDFSDARVVVVRETLNPAGETETVELASSRFQDGRVTLEGEIDKPIEAKIIVSRVEDEHLALEVMIYPGTTVSFALVENVAQLDLLGESRKVRDPSKQFTVSGDLSSIEGNLEGAIVRIRASEYDSTGERIALDFGRVLVEDGKFIVEADVVEPRVVNISIIGPLGHVQTHAVIEPNAQIQLTSQTSWIKGVFATSNESNRHARLVDSWQQTEEYLSTRGDYLNAYQEFQSQKEPSSADSTPLHRELVKVLNRMRYNYLHDIALNSEDPMNALLALELGAYWGKEEALPIYDRLAKSLDDDIVLRRVTHKRNNHASHLATIGFDKALDIGKQVPQFTLSDLNGEKYKLGDFLDKNELVLVDFWASWCGGCLASFPALKDLYDSYHEQGFEIISISIDDHHDAWAERSEEQELPWVDLGELKGFEGKIAKSYGVTFIPKKYLIDSQGKVIQKDLSMDQLESFLESKYGDSQTKGNSTSQP